MEFLSRQDAGHQLGAYLQGLKVQADIVLGLPRGGVVVAAEVAQVLKLPMDVIVVRKIGHPRHREFAVGALAEGDVVILDTLAMERSRVIPEELEEVIAEERERLQEYQCKFEQRSSPELEGKAVLIVDDGLATGLTTEAAVGSAQRRQAHQVFVSAPVTSDSAFARLSSVADQVFCLERDPAFEAVGQYYRHFTQTTDEEVVQLLNESRRRELRL